MGGRECCCGAFVFTAKLLVARQNYGAKAAQDTHRQTNNMHLRAHCQPLANCERQCLLLRAQFPHCSAALRRCSSRVLHCCSIGLLQYCSSAVLERRSFAMGRSSAAAQPHCNTAARRRCSTGTPERCKSQPLQATGTPRPCGHCSSQFAARSLQPPATNNQQPLGTRSLA